MHAQHGTRIDSKPKYTDSYIAKLEMAFGKGFLSPGGQNEVARLVESVDLTGMEILDIGVGIGGPACQLIEGHGARHVTGVDVEEPVLQLAADKIASRNLQDHIELVKIDPGPLPFSDASFDMVFSKDSIIHVADKDAIFSQALRVLRPGGLIVIGDWYCGEQPFTEEMLEWLEMANLDFAIAPIAHVLSIMQNVGFIECKAVDRSDWFIEYSKQLAARFSGEDYPKLVAAFGQTEADVLITRTNLRATAASQGQLRPGHLRGRKSL